MNEFTIRPGEVFDAIRRHYAAMLISFVVAFGVVMAAFVLLPRSYQAEAIVHIGVNYFQNPLTNDMVGQTHDPGELRSERAKILKSSLGVEFANEVGEKFKLFKAGSNDPARASEVEEFLKRVEVVDVTSTQFQIKFRARSAEVAHGVLLQAIETIRQYMFTKRIQTLEQVLVVLEGEIVSSENDRQAGGETAPVLDPKTTAGRAQVSAQITILRKRLDELLRTYSETHPSVQGIRTEISELEAAQQSGTSLTRRRVFQNGLGSLGTLNIKEALSKQKHLINMALEFERKDPTMSNYLSLIKEPIFPEKPFFPKLRNFLLVAVTAAMLAAFAAIALTELWQTSRVAPKEFSRRMKADVVGTLSLVKVGSERK